MQKSSASLRVGVIYNTSCWNNVKKIKARGCCMRVFLVACISIVSDLPMVQQGLWRRQQVIAGLSNLRTGKLCLIREFITTCWGGSWTPTVLPQYAIPPRLQRNFLLNFPNFLFCTARCHRWIIFVSQLQRAERNRKGSYRNL
jgi:hypothetical protein